MRGELDPSQHQTINQSELPLLDLGFAVVFLGSCWSRLRSRLQRLSRSYFLCVELGGRMAFNLASRKAVSPGR